MRRVYGMKVVRLTLGGLLFCPDLGSVLPSSRGAGMELGTPSRATFAGRLRALAGGDAEVMAPR